MNQNNLNQPANWSEGNAGFIAQQFGYALNARFVTAVQEFSQKVEGATVLDYISILGQRHLKEYRPPLDRQARK